MASEITRRVQRLEAAAEVLTDAEIHALLVRYGDEVYAIGPHAPGADQEFDALLDRVTAPHAAPEATRAERWAASRATFARRMLLGT